MTSGTSRLGTTAFYAALFLNAFITFGHAALIQYTIFASYTGTTRLALNVLASALLLLPFILLLVPAGLLSDQRGKLDLQRRSAWALLALCLVVAFCYQQGWLVAVFVLLPLSSVQAALFAPAKYGFIKERFGVERMSEVNGHVAALTIGALVAAVFSVAAAFDLLLFTTPANAAELLQGIAPLGWLLVLGALLELGFLHRIDALFQPASDATFTWRGCVSPRLWRDELTALWQDRALRLSAIGLTTLWTVGQGLLIAIPIYLRDFSAERSGFVVQGPLIGAGLGITLGALFAGRYSRRYLETGLFPLGAFGLTLGLALLPQMQSPLFLALLLFGIGLAAGLCLVPLNALLQYFAPDARLGRTLATSHWLQALGMLLFLALAVAFALLGWSGRALLQALAVIAIAGALHTLYALPQSLTRFLMSRVVAIRYRIKVQGMRHIPVRGGVLLLGNHVSWIDWALVQIACPRPVRFVLNNAIYEQWHLRWFFRRFGCLPIQAGAASRQALVEVAEALRRGEVVCLFPEGVISRNGNLGEFRRGFERACAEVGDDVVIVPFYLRGLWGSFYPHAEHQRRRRRYPLNREVVVDFGAPLPRTTPAADLKRKVGELSNQSWREYADHLPTIGAHWVETCKKRGNPVVLSDTLGARLRSRTALAGSLLLARRMQRLSPQPQVGLLLPSSTGSVLGNMALFMLGKTVVNLNFTASVDSLVSAVLQAEVKTIYTSTRFLERLAARGVDLAPLRAHCDFQLLEDLRADTSSLERVVTLAVAWLLPTGWLKALYCKRLSAQHPAVIMFSSGSEGNPKGVVLTHRNLLCNVKQFTELLGPEDDDVMLANLPPFHAFGLTVTHLMPLLERVPVVCHADPTDVHGAALAIAQHRITILLGTSSFLRLYVRNTKVHPLMLESLRLVVAGAEKLHDDVRREFKEKFNKEVLEGYGATETSPVASVNMPDRLSPDNWRVQVGNKVGSVGLPLPGTSFRIVDPETYQGLPVGEAGMVLISGAQVMQGYLKNEQKNQSTLLAVDGLTWYVTGDKGYLDEDGFLYIQDRYSRFAKVGGEMVGLGTVENALRSIVPDPDIEIVVVNVPDDKKGEKLIALSNHALDPGTTREQLGKLGLNPLAFPAHYFSVEAIPRLGSGKVDYAGSRRLVLDLIAGSL
jgi:acyl-[acyl-carrier-protein]-phospholipid O-acyltransferase/long-chain-fatty-acid--[acyl-carrier-protein] ligase